MVLKAESTTGFLKIFAENLGDYDYNFLHFGYRHNDELYTNILRHDVYRVYIYLEQEKEGESMGARKADIVPNFEKYQKSHLLPCTPLPDRTQTTL